MSIDAKRRGMAEFCRDKCPVCVRARKKGKGFVYTLVKFESKICPYCKAYQEVYGKPAYK